MIVNFIYKKVLPNFKIFFINKDKKNLKYHNISSNLEIKKNILKSLSKRNFKGSLGQICHIETIEKENAESRNAIFMINANDGFIKDGNKNRLRERDIHKIVDVFTNQIEIPKYSRIIPLSEISDKKNNYNLKIVIKFFR